MVKRDKYIDHEEFKIKIRVSSSLNILIQQDMFRFGYLKENKELNPNLFLNHLLPIMEEYRNERNEKLIIALQKEKSSTKLSDEQLNIINKNYYEDYLNSSDEVINLRISKENMKGFDEIKRSSTYIKSLINEYSNMRLDNREILFFIEEYNLIQKAINEGLLISFLHNDVEYNLFPIEIVACSFDSDLFVFGLFKKDENIWIQSMKLCEIESLHITNEKNNLLVTYDMQEDIGKYIYDFEYLKEESKQLGGNQNGTI